jgi:hypothetical protein
MKTDGKDEGQDGKKYDVALSFLGRDLALAQEIRDGLASQLSVFVYSHSQDEVAGTEGLETFPQVFRDDSRLVVVLHRTGWGETPWTRVEAQAMKDRLLDEGAEFLFVVTLDSAATPKWIPKTRIRYSLEDFGVPQLLGVIKARAKDLGSTFHKETVADRAKRAEEQQEFEAERERMMAGSQGVNAASDSAAEMFRALVTHAEEIRESAPKLKVEFAYSPADRTAVLRAGRASLTVYWKANVVNSLPDARLIVQTMNGKVLLPGEAGSYSVQPKVVEKFVFLPDLTRALGWCWKDEKENPMTSDQVAETVADIFLRHIEDVSSGRIPPLDW